MARPVVGIYAAAVPASWGPWRDRPSEVAPAALATAVQRAGATAVLVAHDPRLDAGELLQVLDALIVFDSSAGPEHLEALRALADESGLALLVLDGERVTPASPAEDYAREISELVGSL